MKNDKKKIEIRFLEAGAGQIERNLENDGVDRRGFLKCMAWAGTGMLWTVSSGVLASKILSPVNAAAADGLMGGFNFVQISDSHIGFNKPANTNVIGTLKEAIARINALPTAPDFILHTGDLSHLSEAEEFDALEQLLKGTKAAYFMCPANMTCLTTTANSIANASVGKARATAGTVSTTKAFILSGWST